MIRFIKNIQRTDHTGKYQNYWCILEAQQMHFHQRIDALKHHSAKPNRSISGRLWVWHMCPEGSQYGVPQSMRHPQVSFLPPEYAKEKYASKSTNAYSEHHISSGIDAKLFPANAHRGGGAIVAKETPIHLPHTIPLRPFDPYDSSAHSTLNQTLE